MSHWLGEAEPAPLDPAARMSRGHGKMAALECKRAPRFKAAACEVFKTACPQSLVRSALSSDGQVIMGWCYHLENTEENCLSNQMPPEMVFLSEICGQKMMVHATRKKKSPGCLCREPTDPRS